MNTQDETISQEASPEVLDEIERWRRGFPITIDMTLADIMRKAATMGERLGREMENKKAEVTQPAEASKAPEIPEEYAKLFEELRHVAAHRPVLSICDLIDNFEVTLNKLKEYRYFREKFGIPENNQFLPLIRDIAIPCLSALQEREEHLKFKEDEMPF